MEECLNKLNLMQNVSPWNKFEETKINFIRSGLTFEDLDKLSVIHITGTKGKGSTSAYCESILRHKGYKTGLFMSPHLIHVNERIRLNGIPISEELFTKYFNQVYRNFDNTKKNSEPPYFELLPPYFQFLTIMAFHVFLKEKVDVAIIEVGIGGLYDSTNILRKVNVVGITSIGLDHTAVLGESVKQIAQEKSGIIKQNCFVYTSPDQSEEIIQAIKEKALQKNCQFEVVPKFEELKWEKEIKLGINSEVQKLNVALAVQLTNIWIRLFKSLDKNNNEINKKITYEVDDYIVQAIENCRLDGRSQIIETQKSRYYFDGAHTKESLEMVLKWFHQHRITTNGDWKSTLVFNLTGDRDATTLLELFSSYHFDSVIFVPNISGTSLYSADQKDLRLASSESIQLKKCNKYKQIWLDNFKTTNQQVNLFGNIYDALKSLPNNSHVLLCGSFYLVGAALVLFQDSTIKEEL